MLSENCGIHVVDCTSFDVDSTTSTELCPFFPDLLQVFRPSLRGTTRRRLRPFPSSVAGPPRQFTSSVLGADAGLCIRSDGCLVSRVLEVLVTMMFLRLDGEPPLASTSKVGEVTWLG